MPYPLGVLFGLAVLVLIMWLVFWVLGQMGLPQPARLVFSILLGILFIYLLFQYLPAPTHHRVLGALQLNSYCSQKLSTL